MLDLRLIKKNQLEESVKKRGINFNVNELYDIYEKYQDLKGKIEELNYKCNINSSLKNKEEGKKIKELKKIEEEKLNILKNQYQELLLLAPNIISSDVPIGISEKDNVEIKKIGDIQFKKNHYDLPMFVNNIFASRFIALKEPFAFLERCLANFMMDELRNSGFQEYSLPYLLTQDQLRDSAHLPKSSNDMFLFDKMGLIPTGEAPLVNLGKKQTIEETKKICALTECFRREAGAAGRDTKGMMRVHQFKKCEMVIFAHKEESEESHQYMIKVAEKILVKLEIPYRIILLCSGDMSPNALKTYDIEIPIGGRWREISSISNMGHLQSYRLGCRFKDKTWVHMLNGSGLAVGRTLIGLVENHLKDQVINIPKFLQKYTNSSVISF